MQHFYYPEPLNTIFKKLHQAKIKAVIVGGYVRDRLLNIPSKDIDIELYNVSSLQKIETVLAEFGALNSVGKSFGVVKLTYKGFDLDFSLPRSDNKSAKGHRGFEITIDPSLTFKEAASRRDFTINAIGYDTLEKKILDPYRGREDLFEKRLKAVDLEKFSEDPLRILRAVVFTSRFDLQIDPKLLKLCQKMIDEQLLLELPKERIFEELKKLLLKSKKPSKGFYLLEDLHAFQFFKEFLTLSEEIKRSLFAMLDRAVLTTEHNTQKEKLIIMLALLTSKFSQKDQISFLQRVTDEKRVIDYVSRLTSIEVEIETVNDYRLYKLATKIEFNILLPYLYACYPEKKEQLDKIQKRVKELHIFTKPLPPLVRGSDLIDAGYKPSKDFKKILNEFYEKQMQGKFKTREKALAELKAQ
jgi:tRNA nucleotidyltransferase (CCA-adding enzyme)